MSPGLPAKELSEFCEPSCELLRGSGRAGPTMPSAGREADAAADDGSVALGVDAQEARTRRGRSVGSEKRALFEMKGMGRGSAVAGVGDERNRGIEASTKSSRVHGFFPAPYHRHLTERREKVRAEWHPADTCAATIEV